MINLKNYTLLLIPYLTVVCSLYHLVYYGLFGLNGLDFISVTDIIKSAVYPMLLTFFFATIGIFIAHKFLNSITNRKTKTTDTNKVSTIEIVLKILFLLVFNSILVLVVYFVFNELNFLLIAFSVGNVIFGVLNSDKLINNDIGTYIDKEFLLMLIIYLPCFSIATAIQDAFNILTNKSYKYSIIKSDNNSTTLTNADTLKLIGINEQTFLFTDMRNSKIIFLKNDSMTLYSK